MPKRQEDFTPDYRWNEASGRYQRIDSGQFVGRGEVRGAMLEFIDSSAKDARVLTQRLRDGGVNLGEWAKGIAQLRTNSYLAGAAAARGGWNHLTQADFGRIGQLVREDNVFLANRAKEIESGAQRLDGSILRISELYPRGGYDTFHLFNRLEMGKRGFELVENIRGSGDSCEGCLAADALGIVPLDVMPLPGSRKPCRANCKCGLKFHKADGETSE
jgi:hypothetical protein